MRLPVFPAPINHLLRANSWALTRLLPYAGRVARIENPPFSHMMMVMANGQVADAAPDATPSVTVRLTPGLVLRLLARDATAWNDIKVEGDADFAATLHYVAHHIRWDIEEDISKVVGGIAAHRLVETGRKLDRWGRQGADNLARSFAEYWTEERPLIASRTDVAEFCREVDTLRDAVARLEKRVEQLDSRSLKP